ncbi:MAG: serine/threonine-protein kinase [Verrucomicrobiota bacterium]|nr:serine/threonine-protein kinase [Verrucomicrobiota bacterium]
MNAPQLEGYQLLEQIGEGGMGGVYKARQLSLGRMVAVKILPADAAASPEDVRRFYQEAQLAAQLRHPGIIQVFDFNVVNNCYYFVMELVEGQTVAEWLCRCQAIPVSDALAVAECVADALKHAWDRGRIIHCDVKPDNIMLDSEGTIRVADLGLARAAGSITHTSRDREVLGTPWYMSPEQVEGRADLDCRADIYSLGATLYQMVTGRMLFHGHSANEAMDLQITHAVAAPIELSSGIPKGVCSLIEKMLAKNRDLRHADWDAVLVDIRRVRKGLLPQRPLTAENASTVRRSLFPRTNRAATIARPAPRHAAQAVKIGVAGGIVALGIVLWMGGRALVRPRRQEALPPPKPQAQALSQAEQLFASADAWAAAHHDRYDEALARFRQILPQLKGTACETAAGQRIAALEQGKEISNVLAALREEAASFAAREQFHAAATLFQNYSGRFAAETESERKKAVAEYHDRETRRLASVGDFDGLLDKIAAAVVAKGLPAARDAAAQALLEPRPDSLQRALAAVKSVLEDACAIDKRVLASFQAQVGREIVVDLADGRAVLEVLRVENGQVVCREAGGGASAKDRVIAAPARDLAMHERLRRMGPNTLPEVALAKGMLALEHGAAAKAREYLEKTDASLAPRLVSAAAREEEKP